MAKRSGVFTRRMKGKLFIAFVIVLCFFGIVMVRLTFINFKDGAKYEKQVLSQQNYTTITLPYARGEIEDRNGTPLATSVKVYNLIIEPKNILAADTQRNKSLSKNQEKDIYQVFCFHNKKRPVFKTGLFLLIIMDYIIPPMPPGI